MHSAAIHYSIPPTEAELVHFHGAALLHVVAFRERQRLANHRTSALRAIGRVM
jgi:hypothetical protein